jgi:hypothetical protein
MRLVLALALFGCTLALIVYGVVLGAVRAHRDSAIGRAFV